MLLFSPQSVSYLSLLVLIIVVVAYLVRLPEKSSATKWLIGMLVGLGLSWFGLLRIEAIFGQPSEYVLLTYSILSTTMVAGMSCYLQFAYHFLGNPFPRESRALLVVSAALTLLMIFANMSSGETMTSPFAVMVLILVSLLVFTTVVMTRRWRRATSNGDLQMAGAFRDYALLNVLGIIAFVLMALSALQLHMGEGMWLNVLFVVSLYGFFFGLIAIYLSHAPEATSFQAKLVGLSLVTVLSVLALVSSAIGLQMREVSPSETPSREGLRFTPVDNGGYEVSSLPFMEETDLGEDLRMPDDSSRAVSLNFPFPFYGRAWDSLYVSPNGVVSFGEPVNRQGKVVYSTQMSTPDYFFNEVPKIAPLFVDLDPTAGGGVYLRRTGDLIALTWRNLPRFDSRQTTTVQLILHRGGRFDFLYEDVAPLTYGVRGITPGETKIPISEASLGTGLPYRIPPGTAKAEEFSYKVLLQTKDTTRVLMWMVLLSTLFILIVFPLFFRSSLLEPLQRLISGVRRVNEGDLDTQVPVRVQDEIGRLTESFNQMTSSLRSYARDLEEKVAARTEELESSLTDLQAAQKQLVQQEKMASLGALTAGIAHEIKNPLNFITNFAGVTRELVEELKEAVRDNDPETVLAIAADLALNSSKIEEHGQRADGIVRSMLEHSRGTKGERRPTDLNRLVDEYVNLAFHGMRAQTPGFEASIDRDFDEKLPQVAVVPQEIGRVLLNLLQNAFYAVHEHKAALNGQYAPAVRVRTALVDGTVEIVVEDNGPGIPESVRAKIFEPFFTTKPTGVGTGLGLSLSYDIVVQGHGGTLKVENSEAGGAAFRITLPVAAGAFT